MPDDVGLGRRPGRRAAARSVANVQSKTLRLDPEPAELAGQRGDPERREEHLGGRSGAKVGEDQGYPGHAVPLVRSDPTSRAGFVVHPVSRLASSTDRADGRSFDSALVVRREPFRPACRRLPGRERRRGSAAHVKPSRNEVLLVFPGRYKAPDPQVPLQLLHVAGALRRAGYDVRISDLRLHDYRSLDRGRSGVRRADLHERSADPLRPRARPQGARRKPARADRLGRRAPDAAARADRGQRARRRRGARRGRDGRRSAGRRGWPPARRWTT